MVQINIEPDSPVARRAAEFARRLVTARAAASAEGNLDLTNQQITHEVNAILESCRVPEELRNELAEALGARFAALSLLAYSALIAGMSAGRAAATDGDGRVSEPETVLPALFQLLEAQGWTI